MELRRYQRALFASLFCLVCAVTSAFAEVPAELAIGVPPFNAESDLVSGSDAAIRLVRSGISAPILVPRANSGTEKALFNLILVDNFQVDPTLTGWSFRVRDDVVFTNGQPLRATDICDSLRRCSKESPVESFALVDCEERNGPMPDMSREMVDVRFDQSLNTKELQRAAIGFIAECPIFEARSRGLFGADFGFGSNLLGAGEYRLVGFQSGKSFRIERFSRSRTELAPAPQSVEILSFDHMKDALTALRVGTIGMFINTDVEVATLAAGDETLRLRDCGGRQVIYRRGFQFECTNDIQISSVTWNLP